jgi:hypothetical protein
LFQMHVLVPSNVRSQQMRRRDNTSSLWAYSIPNPTMFGLGQFISL